MIAAPELFTRTPFLGDHEDAFLEQRKRPLSGRDCQVFLGFHVACPELCSLLLRIAVSQM